MLDKQHLKCPEVGIKKEKEGDKTNEQKKLKSVQESRLWEAQKKQNSIQERKGTKKLGIRFYKWQRKAALKNPTMKKWRGKKKSRLQCRKYGLDEPAATRNWKTRHRKCVLTEEIPQMNSRRAEQRRAEMKVLQTHSSPISLLQFKLTEGGPSISANCASETGKKKKKRDLLPTLKLTSCLSSIVSRPAAVLHRSPPPPARLSPKFCNWWMQMSRR